MNEYSPDEPAALATVPGWYGKIPALGDFASRRLPEQFVAGWDKWLSSGIEASRADLGGQWLEFFLSAPVWRFALIGKWFAGNSWSGVLMPSVDRVGRYFPLTIAAPIALPCSGEALRAWGHWLDRLQQVALASLEDSHTVEMLEAALGTAASPAGMAAGAGFDLESAVVTQALRGHWAQCAGESLWWVGGKPAFLRHRGLPPAEFFRTLLGAS